MTVHVFVGPSCPEPLVLKNYPEFSVHGPVKHGDLFSPEISSGDVVVVVDGLYHHRLALRHKEILDALSRSTTVIGASSIGALRAAELHPFGMIGVGRVYDWYRGGVFDGDDAVSVAHGETGPLAGINIPLVNLHSAILAALGAGVLRRDEGQRLKARWEQEYYPLRTSERVLLLADEVGASAFADWYRERVRHAPDAFDQKQADALEAFALADRLHALPLAKRPDAGRTGQDWRTEFHRRWRNRFATAPGLQHRLAYQQIFNAGFPDVWWDYLDNSSSSTLPGASDGFRGRVRQQLGSEAAQWLEEPEKRARITALVCPLPDLADPREADLLLRHETAQDRARAADWLEQNRQHLNSHPGRSLSQIGGAVCAKLLARIWDLRPGDDLAAECGRRGFPSLRQAANAIRPFAIGYLSHVQRTRQGGGFGHA
ncbi:TfuA-like protein [Streptomyces sp. NPDC001904]|uniref:TfuA-like protein n=1 Tax=Streptomyces sp. NPDC001904 TaxID=3154531 RepID=UPI00332A16CA